MVSYAWAMRSAHSASVGRFHLISFSDPDLSRVWCRGLTDMLFLYASDSVHLWERFLAVWINFWLFSENKSTNEMVIATHRLLPIGLFHVFIRLAVSWEDERSLNLLMNIYYAVLIAWCICGWAAGQHRVGRTVRNGTFLAVPEVLSILWVSRSSVWLWAPELELSWLFRVLL